MNSYEEHEGHLLVSDFAKRVDRSPQQIYRDIKSGKISRTKRFFDWLWIHKSELSKYKAERLEDLM